jgi:hypothetical protein
MPPNMPKKYESAIATPRLFFAYLKSLICDILAHANISILYRYITELLY